MSFPDEETRIERRRIGEFAFEAMLAIAALTSWPILDQRHHGSAGERARAMLFLPVVALVFGILLALFDHWMTSVVRIPLRSTIVVAIALLLSGALYPIAVAHAIGELRAGSRPSWTGLTEVGPAGALAALASVALEIYLLSAISHPPARERALVLATMLSRWAIVPIGYGLKPLERRGLGVPWEGGIKFREFAGSSVIAFAIAMGLYQVVAIAAIVAMALAILLLRLLFSRRLGGVPGFALAAGAAACELVAFAVLAALRF